MVSTNLPPRPLLIKEELVEVVGEGGRAEGPGTIISRAVGVSTSNGVSTNESNHFAVIEAHAAEDSTDVVLHLGRIGETAVGSASRGVSVLAARAPRDGRSLHLLDGASTSKGPEIRVGDPREFL